MILGAEGAGNLDMFVFVPGSKEENDSWRPLRREDDRDNDPDTGVSAIPSARAYFTHLWDGARKSAHKIDPWTVCVCVLSCIIITTTSCMRGCLEPMREQVIVGYGRAFG